MTNNIKTIVINTNHKNSAGAKVCVNDLDQHFKQSGFEVIYNDWEYKKEYNLILFMSHDSKVKEAKIISPDSIVGIMDPKIKNKHKIEEIKMADFLLVSSIEQKERLLIYNKNIVIYYMFPDIKNIEKTHKNKEIIVIGYHGNKLHLNNFHPHINNALDRLAEKYDMELNVMYNIETLGKWKKTTPKRIKINHIQWSNDNYYKYLSKCDIGIVPNLMSINKKIGLLTAIRWFEKNILDYNFGYNSDDYLLRYKYSTNPGRIYVFCQLGIPVVSDFTPSSCQFIQDGKSGFIVNGSEGWFTALEKLIIDHQLRQKMADNLNTFIKKNYSIEKNFQSLLKYINNLKK